MKTNNQLSILLALSYTLICVQCTREKGPDPIGDPECKFIESSTSSLTGFAMFDAGPQEEGMAEGVKINVPWQASGYISTDSSGNYSVVLQTFYEEGNPWSLVAEQITLGNIKETETPICYRLVSEMPAINQIATEYRVHPNATYAIHHSLDTTAINEFEVTRFSITESIFEGRFSATFVTSSPDAPEYPEEVRFVNVHIEAKLNPETDNVICVGPEPITAIDTGFYVFEAGAMTEGYAEGVKINMPWKASAFIFTPDPQYGHSLVLKTYWKDEYSTSILAELFYFANFPVTATPICFDLTNDTTATSKIFCRHLVGHDDQPINTYLLDTNAVNKIEIKRFNLEERIFEGKLQASFITDDPALPWLPERVRFFNVDIKIGVD